MEKLISVIIPIYNVEQYLEKCLDSVIHQTYESLEIICVNDCSPDHCAEILEKYAKQDSRIKIVNHEKNGGLSAARNSGLDAATGEYVYFIDSDDWIDVDYIEKMVEAIDKTQVDIVLNTNMIKEYIDKSECFVFARYPKKSEQGEFLDSIPAINDSHCMACCHLYKREFLLKNNLRFPEGYIHEDVYFQYISKIKTDKIFAFYGPAYHYLQRDNSIMNSRKNKIEAYVKIFRHSYDYYKQYNLLTKNNRIKLYRLEKLFIVSNEQEFLMVKKYIDCIAEDFENERMASFDFEKFIFNAVNEAQSLEIYQKKVGKNALVTYLTREKLRRRKNIKVSVIIPIYNAEKYLERCLDSVCSQTLENIEIICVNDCSSDNSLEILQCYAKHDNRMRIIDLKENKGIFEAKNKGLEIAKGEYIGFVDSDDYIALTFYEKLYHKAKETNADAVKGSLIVENGDERIVTENTQLSSDEIKKCVNEAELKIFSRLKYCAELKKNALAARAKKVWEKKRIGINSSKIDAYKKDVLLLQNGELGITDVKRQPRCIVSLTSFPQRMNDIHYCLCSLLKQTVKPDEIILWLGEEQFQHRDKDIPAEVLKLQENGLTIKFTKDIKSYKKLIPALQEYENDVIVTADDDILYPSDWFEKLYTAHLEDNKNIVCHRAHKVKLISDKQFAFYRDWEKCINDNSMSFLNFCTTGGGVLFPPKSLYKDVLNEDLFMKLAPHADDIWFWTMAVLNKRKIRVVKEPVKCIMPVNYERELNGETTLYAINIVQNDVQLKNIVEYYPEVFHILAEKNHG